MGWLNISALLFSFWWLFAAEKRKPPLLADFFTPNPNYFLRESY